MKSVVASTAPRSKKTSKRRSSRPRTPLKTVRMVPDHPRLVLDRHGGHVLHVVAEDRPAPAVDPHGRTEQPGHDVGGCGWSARAAPHPRPGPGPSARSCGRGRRPRWASTGRRAACSPWPRPARPLSTVRCNRFMMGWKREWKPTWAVTPDAVTASQMVRDLGEGRRQRLLAEQWLSRRQRGPHQIEVGGRRRRDHHRVDPGIGDDVERIGAQVFRRGSSAARRPGRRPTDRRRPRPRSRRPRPACADRRRGSDRSSRSRPARPAARADSQAHVVAESRCRCRRVSASVAWRARGSAPPGAAGADRAPPPPGGWARRPPRGAARGARRGRSPPGRPRVPPSRRRPSSPS